MNKINFYLLCSILVSFNIHAQILNGSFEEWASGNQSIGQPIISTDPIVLTPITQSSFVHSGSSALKGEVLEIPTEEFPTSAYQPPIGYDLPVDNYLLELNNFTDSSSYVFFFTDSTVYNYIRSDATNNEMDLLNFSESGMGIKNPDPVMKNAILETIISQDTTNEKSFKSEILIISVSDSIHFQEKDRNELLLQNYGQSMDYDLQVRIASANGESNFFHMSVPMTQNSAHQIVPVWDNLTNEPVKILIDLGNDGTIDDSLFIENEVTNIENQNYVGIPKQFNLLQNYPNPFNPTTTITFDLPVQSEVNLVVYNLLGQKVTTLVDEVKQAGRYHIVLDTSGLSSGIYFYRLKTEKFVQTKKMILLR